MRSDPRRAPGRASGLLCLIVLAGTLGCGLRFGQRPAPEMRVEVGDRTTACLAQARDTLSEYVSGKASAPEVEAFWGCLQGAIENFRHYTTGARSGVYTQGELTKFLQRYFLRNSERPIPPRLASEALELKRALVGGDADRITDGELERLGTLLSSLRDASLELRPFLPLPLMPASFDRLDRSRLLASIASLKVAAGKLGWILQKQGSPYSFSHLQSLLDELSAFLNEPTGLAKASQWIPLLRQATKMLVTSDADRISVADWPRLMESGADVYGLYARLVFVFHEYPNWYVGAGREDLMEVFGDAYSLLSGALQRSPRGTILFEDLDAVIEDLDPAIFSYASPISDPETAKAHVKLLLRPLLRRILVDRATRLDNRLVTEGLTQSNLDRLREIVVRINEGQKALEKRFEWLVSRQDASVSMAGGKKGPAWIDRTFSAEDLLLPGITDLYGVQQTGLDRVTVRAWSEGEELFRESLDTDQRSLFRPHDWEIDFSLAKPPFSFDGLSKVNLFDELVEVVFDAYAGDPRQGLRQDPQAPELEAFYKDVRALGIDLKLFDPHGVGVPQRRFLEGSLFTFASDGSSYLSREETTGLVFSLISTHDQAERMLRRLQADCPQDGSKPLVTDIYGIAKMDASCARRALFGPEASGAWDHMPGFLRYYEGLPERAGAPGGGVMTRRLFECLLEKVSRPDDHVLGPDGMPDPRAPPIPPDPHWYSWGDLEMIAGMSHYLETIFLRFDKNGDGWIDREEARAAFPLLKQTLAGFIRSRKLDPYGILESDAALDAVLDYLLAYGKPPRALDYARWRAERILGGGSFEADRARVLEVMGVITGRSLADCQTSSPPFGSGGASNSESGRSP